MKTKILILVTLLFLLVPITMCGPTPEQTTVMNSVGEVVTSLSSMAIAMSGGMMPTEVTKGKEEVDPEFTADFDDVNDPFYNENINGQISITFVVPTVDSTPIDIADGYSTPFESLDLSEGPEFPEGSPLAGDMSEYFQTLLGADTTTGEVDLDSTEMNTIITTINDEIVTSGNPIGFTMSASITYTDFCVPAEMDYTLTGTVNVSLRFACGAKVTGTVQSGSTMVMNQEGLDLDITATVKPSLRLAFEIEFDTTELEMVKEEETTIVSMTDLLIDGYFTETLTAGATVVINTSQDEFSVTDVSLSHSIEDNTNFSGGEIIVDGETLPSNFAGTDIGKKMFQPFMNYIEENMEDLVDQLENNF